MGVNLKTQVMRPRTRFLRTGAPSSSAGPYLTVKDPSEPASKVTWDTKSRSDINWSKGKGIPTWSYSMNSDPERFLTTLEETRLLIHSVPRVVSTTTEATLSKGESTMPSPRKATTSLPSTLDQ